MQLSQPLPEFKIRASAACDILAGEIGLTDKQKERIKELRDRDSGIGKPLTLNMQEELIKLTYKEEHPDLPSGAQAYCQKWIKEQLYDRRKNFTNKYLEKGLQCEDGSIEFASSIYGWGAIKNDEWFEDDFMQGTPDIIIENQSLVIDIKNAWDCFTFPLFDQYIPTKGYDDQLQVYLALTGHENATLCYVLMDAPLDIMKEEMRKLSWKEGSMGHVTDELYQKVKEQMTYSHLPPELRLKSYTVQKNDALIEKLKTRVIMCREYINQLITYK